jgi:hypothetical protein
VTIKQADVCVVEPSDDQPREIHDCSYSVGDTLVITYTEGAAAIDSHRLK